MAPRKKWAADWDAVRYCSARCRGRGAPGEPEARVEEEILALVQRRGAGKTACPSEVARALWPEAWEGRVEEVREAARRLVHAGKLDILQGGRRVDPSTARGPIRLRLRAR